MISSRYAWPIVALLAFALIPTVLNVYRSPEPMRAGALEAQIPADLGWGPAREANFDEGWTYTQFGTSDFVNRKYASRKSSARLVFFAARHHDTKKLFHFPEIALSRGKAETARHMEEIQTNAGPVPVHVIEFETKRGTHRAAYVLFYGKTGVAQPIRFMLGQIPSLFVGRREPMTILYVQASSTLDGAGAIAAELDELLIAACNGYLK